MELKLSNVIHYLNLKYESVPGVMTNGWLVHEEKDHIIDIVWDNPNFQNNTFWEDCMLSLEHLSKNVF